MGNAVCLLPVQSLITLHGLTRVHLRVTKARWPFLSLLHLSVLCDLGRTALCACLSLTHTRYPSGLYSWITFFRSKTTPWTFSVGRISLGFHSLSLHLEELSVLTITLRTSVPVLCVRIGAPLGDTHLFVSAVPSPMPTTGISDLGKQVIIKCCALCRVLKDMDEIEKKPKECFTPCVGEMSGKPSKLPFTHIALFNPYASPGWWNSSFSNLRS